jgi:predicted acetyltransferase
MYSERGKGYATEATKQLLKKVRDSGYTELMMDCDIKNIGSARVIEKCDGVLRKVGESRHSDNGEVFTRNEYWIFEELS